MSRTALAEKDVRPSRAAEAEAAPPVIRRRFLDVGSRRVHYLKAGNGPPAVLVHSSPANAWLLRPEIERLSRDFTVFAFDTPGFGRSDPLPLERMSVADLADALLRTLRAIGMPPCPMYGTHTGAAIALEFGARHPDQVTGLVLDGLPVFTDAECEALFGGYFRPFPISDLGGHFSEVWTRFRDQYVWFPWTARAPEALNPYDLGRPEGIHAWVSMYFDAAEHYAPAYRAALSYGENALAAAARLERPAIYTATPTDMLFPHLARLPPLKPGQEIKPVDGEPASKLDLIAEGFADFGSYGVAPPDSGLADPGAGMARRFLDRLDGGQLHVRLAGARTSPPLLLLHDSPGSAERLEPLIEALGRERFVIAPDLPGAGDSDPLADGATQITPHAAAVVELMDNLGLPSAHVHGLGFGAGVAVELARSFPRRVERLSLEGLPLPDEVERAELKDKYAPTIAVEPDGSHWYRLWLQLRDQGIWWPWYDRRLPAQRRRSGEFDGRRLHRWTVDVMRRRETYAQPILAALGQDAAAALAEVSCPVARFVDGATPLSVYDDRLRALAPGAREARASDDPDTYARGILSAFEGRG